MAGQSKLGSGSRARILAYLLVNLNRTIDGEEIRKASGNVSEWARRTRELRSEFGYQILTHKDRADLKPGQYRLETDKPLSAFARNISAATRAFVLERNGYTCQMCGLAAGDPNPLDPSQRIRLTMGHIVDKSRGGTDDASNLRAVCNLCNEGLQNLGPMKPDLKQLLIQVRRATIDDQLAVLDWLEKKFRGARMLQQQSG